MSAVDKQLVKELESSDVRRRKQAIEKLAASHDPTTIKLLVAVSRQDKDAALRELALNAARTRNPQLVESVLKTAEKPKPSTALSPTAKEAKKRALALAETAMTFHTSGNDANALKQLAQALTTYPDVRYEGYFMNIVQAITGEDGDAALQSLPKPSKSFFGSLFGK
jgi:hypothetical protein